MAHKHLLVQSAPREKIPGGALRPLRRSDDAGIIDPTKVARIALENAVSVASLLLTEATLTEVPEPKTERAEPGAA